MLKCFVYSLQKCTNSASFVSGAFVIKTGDMTVKKTSYYGDILPEKDYPSGSPGKTNCQPSSYTTRTA
jgi:hypothetical protein